MNLILSSDLDDDVYQPDPVCGTNALDTPEKPV